MSIINKDDSAEDVDREDADSADVGNTDNDLGNKDRDWGLGTDFSGRTDASESSDSASTDIARPSPDDVDLSDRQQQLLESESAASFIQLMDSLDVDSVSSDTLDYVENRLEAWPDTSRIAPDKWVRLAIDGDTSPPWHLARAVQFTDDISGNELSELLTSPALQHITILNLSFFRAFQKSHVTDLHESAYTDNVKYLDLSYTAIGGSTLSQLLSSRIGPQLEYLDLETLMVDQYGTGLVEALTGESERLNLKTLKLTATEAVSPDSLTKLFSSKAVSYLKRLSLTNPTNDLAHGLPPEILLKILSSDELSNLVELNLAGQDVTPAVCKLLSNSMFASTLRILRIGSEGDSRSLKPLLQGPIFDGLTGLVLSGWNLSPEALKALSRNDGLSELEELQLNRTDDASAIPGAEIGTELQGASFGPSLKTLSLTNWNLNGPAAESLATERFSGIESLLLDSNQLGDEDIGKLANTGIVKGLQTLALRQNNLTGKGLELLLASDSVEQLDGLWLGANQIGDEGAIKLAESGLVEQLRVLDLSDNNLGPGSMKALLQLENDAASLDLELDANDIGSEGVQNLVEHGNFKAVDSIRLTDNGIGNKGLKALAESKKLEELNFIDLSDNDIGWAGAQALANSKYVSLDEGLPLGPNDGEQLSFDTADNTTTGAQIRFHGPDILMDTSLMESVQKALQQQSGDTASPTADSDTTYDHLEQPDIEPPEEIPMPVVVTIVIFLAIIILAGALL
jgi:hypothetical protein